MKRKSKHIKVLPNFWPKKFRSKIPEDMKNWIYDQYYNQQTLIVYCDASIKHDQSVIGIACSFVANGSVMVKQKYITSPSVYEVVPPIYAEMKSLMFGLDFFNDYVNQCNEVIIYSDVNHIERILANGKVFNKHSLLQTVRDELITLYNQKCNTSDVNLSIKYLPKNKKKFNPFYKSAHNAANKMARNTISR